MIRFVVSFPHTDIRPEQIKDYALFIKEAADSREWRDIVMSHGGTITDMRPRRNPKPVWVKNVQRRLK